MKKKNIALLMSVVMLAMSGCGDAQQAAAIVQKQQQKEMKEAYSEPIYNVPENKSTIEDDPEYYTYYEEEKESEYEDLYESNYQWSENRPDETASMEEWDQYLADEIRRIIQGDEVDVVPSYEFGEFTEYGYRSEYLGYRFAIPENCRLLLARELFVNVGFTDEEIDANYAYVESQYEDLANLMDLFALYPDTGTCMGIAVETVNQSEYTVEEAVQSCVDVVEETSGGLMKADGTFEEVEFAGHTYLKAVAKQEETNSGQVAYQEIYGMFYNDRFVYITFVYMEGNVSEAEALKNAMKPLENVRQELEYSDLADTGMTGLEIKDALEEDKKSKFFFGTFTSKGYQSDCLGYAFTTPSGWKLEDYSRLAKVSGMGESVTDSNFADMISNCAYESEACELYAVKESTGSIVSVWVGTSLYSSDDLEWQTLADAEPRIEQYSSDSWDTLRSIDSSYVEIAGKEYVKVVIDINDGQEQYVEEHYRAISNNEDYLIAITYKLGNEADCDEILEAFSNL